MASEPVSIFLSYSRKDEALMRELESHLEPLRLSRLIESWHDGCITPGEEWEPKIKENLETAQIILLLITVNFISSEYCNAVELTKAIERHKAGAACIIPLILKPCMWQPIPVGGMTLGELQALPKDAKPVTLWSDRDEAFENIARSLLSKIEQLRLAKEKAATEETYKANLKRYQQELLFAVSVEYPLSQTTVDNLTLLEQQLALNSSDVLELQRSICESAEDKYQKHLKALRTKYDRQRENEVKRLVEAEQDSQPLSQKPEEAAPINSPQSQQVQELNQAITNPTNWVRYVPSPVEAAPKLNSHSEFFQPLQESISPGGKGLDNSARVTKDLSILNPSQQITQIQSVDGEDLTSAIFQGNVYEKLKNFLALGQWQNADIETEKRILELLNRQNSVVRIEDTNKIPIKDLRNIDSLWIRYSNGRFGFSVQKRLWQEFDETIRYGKPWDHFGKHLGWRRQKALPQRGFDWLKRGISPLEGYEWIVVDELQFDLFAPEGHLPVGPFIIGSIPHYQFLSKLNL